MEQTVPSASQIGKSQQRLQTGAITIASVEPTIVTTGSEQNDSSQFTLLGGPLHEIGKRLGLVRGHTNTIRLGLVIGWSLWIVALALTLLESRSVVVFSLPAIAAHLRFLVAIPLLFLAESWVDPRIGSFVNNLFRSGIVPAKSQPLLADEIKRVSALTNSWVVEAVCLLTAFSVSLLTPSLGLSGVTSNLEATHGIGGRTLVGIWYWMIGLPLFRFLALRWLWRICLWWRFLWRVSRMPLHLIPTHPDGSAGLGGLEVVHIHFVPLVAAISVVFSASFAEEIAIGAMPFEAIYPELPIMFLVDGLLFVSPLMLFAQKLWLSRIQGLNDYMLLATRYVDRFEKKWLAANAPMNELLGTSDLQSLADLTNSVKVIRDIRFIPVSPRLLINLAIAAVVPLAPLLLLKYPVAELAKKFLQLLLGV
jgi:hypothetical protein